MKDKYSSVFEVERSRVIEREFLRPFLRPGAEVLDVGAGAGHYSGLMRSLGGRVRCVDYDQAKVDMLKDAGFDALRADAQEVLPFPDGSFDFVTALEVIEHLEKPQRLLAEAARVLKDDGLLLISTPNRRSLEALVGHISGLFTGRKWRAWDDSHRRIYSPAEIKAEVSAFFDILKLTGFYLMHKGRFVPSGLCFTSFNGGILAERSFIINILARPRRRGGEPRA